MRGISAACIIVTVALAGCAVRYSAGERASAQGVKAGQELTGWIMDQDREIKARAQSDVPMGHKVAIRELKSGETVIKYGVDIGRTIAPIKVGEHAHVHNIKTKRW